MTTTTYKTYQQRVDRLTRINAMHLKNSILRNDGAALEVAGNIGRYISDIQIVSIVRANLRNDKEKVAGCIESLLTEAIQRIAAEKAEAQANRYGATASDVMALLEQEGPMCIVDISNRLLTSPDKVRAILDESPARLVKWDYRDGCPVRMYGLPAEAEAA